MSDRDLFPVNTLSAYQDYVYRLTDAVKRRDWIYDPSFALGTDAQVYEKVRRDPVAEHAMGLRRHLIAGSSWHVEPASDQAEDVAAAEIVEELLRNLHGFTDARVILSDAVFRGSAWAYVEGARALRRVGQHIGAWWAPQRLVDVDRRRFRLAQADREYSHRIWEMWSIERDAWEPLERPEWWVTTVYQKTEDSLGYGRGLLNTLYLYQAAKSRVMQDALMASERFGQGMIVAKIDGIRGADGKPTGRDGDSVAEEWLEVLRNMTARNGIVHDARDEVSVLSGMGEGFGALMTLIEYLDAAQTMAVLGATVPTMSPNGGSFALAKEQSNSTAQLVRADRERLGEDLTRDLIGLIWSQNQGQLYDAGLSRARMPSLILDHEQREDPEVNSRVIATLLAAGVDLRAEEVYQKTGFTAPAPGDEVIKGGQQVDPLALPDPGLAV